MKTQFADLPHRAVPKAFEPAVHAPARGAYLLRAGLRLLAIPALALSLAACGGAEKSPIGPEGMDLSAWIEKGRGQPLAAIRTVESRDAVATGGPMAVRAASAPDSAQQKPEEQLVFDGLPDREALSLLVQQLDALTALPPAGGATDDGEFREDLAPRL